MSLVIFKLESRLFFLATFFSSSCPELLYEKAVLKNLTSFPLCYFIEKMSTVAFAAGIYLLRVNNGDIRTMCEIWSKLIIKTPERHHWYRSDVFNFGKILHTVLVFPLLISHRSSHQRCSVRKGILRGIFETFYIQPLHNKELQELFVMISKYIRCLYLIVNFNGL